LTPVVLAACIAPQLQLRFSAILCERCVPYRLLSYYCKESLPELLWLCVHK
jgi:hypothetical protein